MNALLWRIYYEDGTTFDNLQGGPDAAPAFGVLAVVCLPDLWGCGDLLGLAQYLARPGMEKCVRFGVLASNDVYDRVLTAARADAYFPITRHVYEQGDYYWWRGVQP